MNEIDIYRQAVTDGAVFSLLFEAVGILLITLVYYVFVSIKKE